PLDARLFVPPIPSGGLLVYFHGGGFVVLDADAYAVPCSVLARASGAHVLSIDYRRAPEHRFPAAAEDAWAAYRYAAEHAAEFGGRSGAVSVGGDSAGGNLAGGVDQRAVGDGGPAPGMQLLSYP